MRITFITTSFHPNKGGVEKHVLSISRELIARGHAVTVLAPRTSGAADQETYDGIDIARFTATPFFIAWFSLWKYRNLIRGSDVVHLHDFPTYVWAWPSLALLRKKFFITFHGWEGRVPPRPLFVRLRKMIERRCAGSIAVGDYIVKWYGQHPTVISYGGVPRGSIVPQRTSKPDDRLELLYFGRLAPDTGALDVLEFFSRMLAVYPHAHCTILGDGSLKPTIERSIADKKLDIELHGWVDNARDYLERSDVVVCTGYLGILETMAAGAIVCSLYDNDLKRDYIMLSPFSKLTVHADTPEKLAEKLHALHADATAEIALRTAAHAFILDHTWDRVVTSYERLWQGNPR